MAHGAGVVVIAEHAGQRLDPVTLEAVTAARSLADAMDTTVTLGVIGADVDGVSRELAAVSGVDDVVMVNDDRLAVFSGLAWTAAVVDLIRQIAPSVVLAPGTTSGRDYLPRVAARLKTGHAADAVAVVFSDGKVTAIRPVLGSRAQSAVAFEGEGIATLTMRPGASARAAATGGSAPVRAHDVALDERDLIVKADTPEGATGGAQALDSAERIVAGGRGLGSQDRFALVEELAGALNAAVAVTRPLSDAGWRPHTDQIGQTGARVSPKLYIAVGISGAVQHLVGVQNADYIVAINRDANAPIFKVASYGIVGDLLEVVPAVIDELRATQG